MLEQEGADVFFGEPEFDVDDLMRTTPDGKGIISVLELSDVMDKPRLFSTFMLWMLAQLYESLPEAGDLPKPKLCFFFDEAHLLFDDASEALMEQVERTVRLIRSKGVGVYFVTQAPTDVPSSVLAQLGNRVQHALRAFTPEDADALRKTARTFPMTAFYDVEGTITSLGTGEALVTVLSPRGVPTPLAATRLLPPDSLMAPLDPQKFAALSRRAPCSRRVRPARSTERAPTRSSRHASRPRAPRPPAAAAARAGRRGRTGTAGAPGGMTPAQQRREIERQVREQARAQREVERARKAAQREAAAEARRRERMVNTGVRTAGSRDHVARRAVAAPRRARHVVRGRAPPLTPAPAPASPGPTRSEGRRGCPRRAPGTAAAGPRACPPRCARRPGCGTTCGSRG